MDRASQTGIRAESAHPAMEDYQLDLIIDYLTYVVVPAYIIYEAGIVPAIVDTDIPARLDRLPWGGFHTLVVAALGVTWILDGLEVTLAPDGR